MTISNFHLESKGAAQVNPAAVDSSPHDFTYLVADNGELNFHMFCDEHETWIVHRDNGKVKNVDPKIVQRLVKLCPMSASE